MVRSNPPNLLVALCKALHNGSDATLRVTENEEDPELRVFFFWISRKG